MLAGLPHVSRESCRNNKAPADPGCAARALCITDALCSPVCELDDALPVLLALAAGPIVSLSLGGPAVMEMRLGSEVRAVALPPRSLLVMTSEARYCWCVEQIYDVWCCTGSLN